MVSEPDHRHFFTEAMATSSSILMNPFLGQSTSEKLAKGNHVLWKAQILAVMRVARLEGFLIGGAGAGGGRIDDQGR
jgi:hypothetical protein